MFIGRPYALRKKRETEVINLQQWLLPGTARVGACGQVGPGQAGMLAGRAGLPGGEADAGGRVGLEWGQPMVRAVFRGAGWYISKEINYRVS